MRYYTIIPNMLTILRIALTPLLLFFLFRGGWYIGLGLFTFVIAALTDYYDGYLARYLGVQSEFGRFFDPLADKILILGTFGMFALLSIIPWWMVICIGARDVFITLLRVFLSCRGVLVRTSRLGKWKTAMQLVSILMILAVWFCQWLMGVSVFYVCETTLVGSALYVSMCVVVMLTIISGLSYILQHRRDLMYLFRAHS